MSADFVRIQSLLAFALLVGDDGHICLQQLAAILSAAQDSVLRVFIYTYTYYLAGGLANIFPCADGPLFNSSTSTLQLKHLNDFVSLVKYLSGHSRRPESKNRVYLGQPVSLDVGQPVLPLGTLVLLPVQAAGGVPELVVVVLYPASQL